MIERRCPYCLQTFSPSIYQPTQTVCSDPGCQRQRRSTYRRTKIADDPNYREACRQSSRQCANSIPITGSNTAQAHPSSVERNRQQQRLRDTK